MIDDCTSQDNRAYEYPAKETQYREEYPIIRDWISDGSNIIDFGCGDGSLLKILGRERNVTAIGYDISESGIQSCKEKGVAAICDRIDKVHPELTDNSFDYAICNVTLQMVNYPEVLLEEMFRVSTWQIISFPNFAYYKNRVDMALRGRMPTPMLFGYQWFSTGHIHQFSIQDFRNFVAASPNTVVEDEHHIGSNRPVLKGMVRAFPNMLSKIAIFLL